MKAHQEFGIDLFTYLIFIFLLIFFVNFNRNKNLYMANKLVPSKKKFRIFFFFFKITLIQSNNLNCQSFLSLKKNCPVEIKCISTK